VSTVDAFQGGEKEIIFLSCCRTSGLGFTASPNRFILPHRFPMFFDFSFSVALNVRSDSVTVAVAVAVAVSICLIRMNVAITRARRHLVVVGNVKMLLEKNVHWKKIAERAASLPAGRRDAREYQVDDYPHSCRNAAHGCARIICSRVLKETNRAAAC